MHRTLRRLWAYAHAYAFTKCCFLDFASTLVCWSPQVLSELWLPTRSMLPRAELWDSQLGKSWWFVTVQVCYACMECLLNGANVKHTMSRGKQNVQFARQNFAGRPDGKGKLYTGMIHCFQKSIAQVDKGNTGLRMVLSVRLAHSTQDVC